MSLAERIEIALEWLEAHPWSGIFTSGIAVGLLLAVVL